MSLKNILNDMGNENEVRSGMEGRTVFSKVSYEILELYSNGCATRFPTFNKDVAYSMMINDRYLSRVSEKNVNITFIIKIN